MNPRILIVEDDEDQLDGNEKDILQISDVQRQYVGIESFVIHKAGTKEDALALLKKAVEDGLPYHLMLLDLSVPVSKKIVKESPERGLEVLAFACEMGAAKGIIVASVFSMYSYVVRAFQGGAVDFIAKPYDRGTLQTRVLKYFEKEGARFLEQRIKDLVPYAEKGLAHRLGACFSRFVQAVVNETEGMEEGFKDRWGLDVDRNSQDAQVQHLLAVYDAVGDAKREWTEVLSSLIGGDEAPRVCVAEELLSEIKADVQPCLALKRVELTGNWSGATPVRTFRDDVDDVKAVFKEIILGALSQLVSHDDSEEKTINVSVNTDSTHAEVRFKDNLPSVDEEAVSLINRGIIIPPGRCFGRVWGLSIAQHLALRGGGRIKVESSGAGNIITYSIPLADHA